MPNIATVLKEEIARLSRRESRLQIDPTKKTTTQLRHDVASLKSQVTMLERQVAMLSRKMTGGTSAAVKADSNPKPTRYSAKGLQAQRSRIGLCQRSAYWSQLVIGINEPAHDRHIGATP